MEKESINAIVLGSTGMVGEGVLHECLKHPLVESVLVINRKPCGVEHDKLKEIIHKDFLDFSPIESQLQGYNACYFCMGVSSIGMNERDYTRITYDLTMHVANKLIEINGERSRNLTFCYVSGMGTDSSEKGKIMWARVKGKTENDLMKLPFKKVFNFRPGFIRPTSGLKNAYKSYKYFTPFYPFIRRLFPKYVTTLEEIGLAMLNVTLNDYEKETLECKDIVSASSL